VAQRGGEAGSAGVGADGEGVDVVARVADGSERAVAQRAGHVGCIGFALGAGWRTVSAQLVVGVGGTIAAGAQF
jgi:hypothetical protein